MNPYTRRFMLYFLIVFTLFIFLFVFEYCVSCGISQQMAPALIKYHAFSSFRYILLHTFKRKADPLTCFYCVEVQ